MNGLFEELEVRENRKHGSGKPGIVKEFCNPNPVATMVMLEINVEKLR